jgi:ABC-type nitrate/sulfonate/bicarbonate transport system substrate-binding protein
LIPTLFGVVPQPQAKCADATSYRKSLEWGLDRRQFLMLPAAAAACGRARQAGVRKLSVALGSYMSMSPFYVAYERGYFRSAGFDIAIRVTRSATEVMPLLAQGTLDVGFLSSAPSLFNLIAQGARLRIAAAREFASGCTELGILYERQARFPAGDGDARAWRGKRVAVQNRGGMDEFAFDALRRRLGLAADQVKTAYMDKAAALAALLAGGIDAMINPFGLPLDLGPRQPEFLRNAAAARLVSGLQYSYIVFARSLLDGDPQMGADFLQAYFRGAREYLAGATPDYLERWIRENGLNRELVLQTCRTSSIADGSLRMADLQKYADWANEKGYSQPAKAEGMVDLRWLERAHRGQS